MVAFKIKKGDKVVVVAGKDKGKVGDILKMFPADSRCLVSGVNEVKKHQKPTRESKGGIVTKAMPIHISNVAYYDEKTKSPVKLGRKMVDKTKKRFIRKTNEILGE
ncbi:MAG: 50S ribosomal protein L24 [Rickettsiales bacterium]